MDTRMKPVRNVEGSVKGHTIDVMRSTGSDFKAKFAFKNLHAVQ